MTATRILVCTVGGSDEPIVTAIRSDRWDSVVFVCTESSVEMITQGVNLAAGRPLATPRPPPKPKPPIPQQAGLDPACWTTRIVPPDDPDAAYAELIGLLDQLKTQHPHAEVSVDFTGGTKSMSAGAVLAATSRAGTGLQVTTGQRNDLVRVVDGTQQAVRLGTDRILIERQIELLRATWSQYGYQEAAQGFEELAKFAREKPGVSAQQQGRLKFWAALGRAFAAWDRFDRRQAAAQFTHPRRIATSEIVQLADLADSLKNLATTSPSSLVLFDLLRNAQRCLARGRYDDAVARCYRLWEMTAQWLLQAEAGILTGDIDPNIVPANLLAGMAPKANGRYQIGSAKAWALYRFLLPDREATRFWDEVGEGGKSNTERYEDLGRIRNDSILAHGVAQIDERKGKKVLDWTAGPFMTMVREVASRLGQPTDTPQLPTDLPEPNSNSSRPF